MDLSFLNIKIINFIKLVYFLNLGGLVDQLTITRIEAA